MKYKTKKIYVIFQYIYYLNFQTIKKVIETAKLKLSQQMTENDINVLINSGHIQSGNLSALIRYMKIQTGFTDFSQIWYYYMRLRRDHLPNIPVNDDATDLGSTDSTKYLSPNKEKNKRKRGKDNSLSIVYKEDSLLNNDIKINLQKQKIGRAHV